MGRSKLPIAMLGLGGLGVLGVIVAAGTESGRTFVRALFDNFGEAPERLEEWNDAAQTEIENIQSAINDLARALGVRTAQ